MANGNNKHNKNVEDAVGFSNIFDFTDPMTGEQYTKRPEPIVSTSQSRQGKKGGVDNQIPDQKNRGWMSGWEKARKRVATSPVSFHADELIPAMKGIFDNSNDLEEPFRDKAGDLFGGMGLERKGPQYGLPLDVRMKTLLGDVKRGDDIIDCYIRGLETPTRRKTYSLQQPPGRSFGLGGQTRDQKADMDRFMQMAGDAFGNMNKSQGGSGGSKQSGSTGGYSGSSGSSGSSSSGYDYVSSSGKFSNPTVEPLRQQGFVESQTFEDAKTTGNIYQDEDGAYWLRPGMNRMRIPDSAGITGKNIPFRPKG